MKPLVVFGSSDHASVIISAAKLQKSFKPIAILSADENHCKSLLDVPVVGNDAHFESLIEKHDNLHVIIGIGYNGIRARLVKSIMADYPNVQFATIIHPSSTIDENSNIGAGCYIAAGVIINNGARIGSHAIVNTGAIIEHHVHIADFTFVGSNASLAGNVSVGHSSMIGTAATVLPKITVEASCIVGAGAVVVNDVEKGATVVGVPARKIS